MKRRFNWWYLYYGAGAIGIIVIMTYATKGELPW